MVKGITKTGFSFAIDEKVMNDMEILEAITDSDSSDMLTQMKGYSRLLTKVLGSEKAKLYDHVRTDDGRVPMDALKEEVLDIFSSFGDSGKKSLHSEE